MYARISLLLLAATLFAPPLLAQTPQAPTDKPARPPARLTKATTGELPKELTGRLLFMRKMYTLDESQLAKARAEMTALADEHKNYMDGRQMMLRRLSKAILLVLPSQPDLTDADRETIRKKLQRKIHRIHAEAPLSYTAIAKLVEKSLDKDAIARGRKQMASSFARQLAGAVIDINNLDTIVISPLRPTADLAAAPPPVARPSLNPPTRPRGMAQPDRGSHAGHKHAAHAKLPPPPKGKLPSLRTAQPILAAPPVERWPEMLKASVTNYGFSSTQSKSADLVLGSCRERAEAHLAARKLDYDNANQLTDPQAKAKQIKELNQKVDRLYHEMNQRIDSIASIEQRLASQAAAEKAPADKKPVQKKPAQQPPVKKTTAKSDPGK